jgi:hypothetical protein
MDEMGLGIEGKLNIKLLYNESHIQKYVYTPIKWMRFPIL